MGHLSESTAVILAGGLGTRLRPVAADRPKVLAEVQGRPFLVYLLDQLESFGIREVVLCTGYLGGQVRARFGEAYGPLRLLYSQESSPLGTGGALRLALPLIQSDPVLVMNGDSFYDTDLNAFFTWHEERGAMATMLLVEVEDMRHYGRVDLGGDSLIVGFVEKDGQEGRGWVNSGIYLVSRFGLETLQVGEPFSLERDVFPSWIGKEFYGYRGEGYFLDMGTPEGYALAESFFLRKRGIR